MCFRSLGLLGSTETNTGLGLGTSTSGRDLKCCRHFAHWLWSVATPLLVLKTMHDVLDTNSIQTSIARMLIPDSTHAPHPLQIHELEIRHVYHVYWKKEITYVIMQWSSDVTNQDGLYTIKKWLKLGSRPQMTWICYTWRVIWVYLYITLIERYLHTAIFQGN